VSGERWLCSPCFFEVRQQGRQCLLCGTGSAGTGKANWARHPGTGAEWLCSRCYRHEYRRLQRQPGKRQQLQQQPQAVDEAPAAKRQRSNEQQEQQEQAMPQVQQQQQQQDLFSQLLEAAALPDAAAAGLTVELAASFSALLDGLPADLQAVQVRGRGGGQARRGGTLLLLACAALTIPLLTYLLLLLAGDAPGHVFEGGHVCSGGTGDERGAEPSGRAVSAS
jgi:hypothetical protein